MLRGRSDHCGAILARRNQGQSKRRGQRSVRASSYFNSLVALGIENFSPTLSNGHDDLVRPRVTPASALKVVPRWGLANRGATRHESGR